MSRVLFVCLGNICRSPTAEGVFAALAEAAGVAVSADSAGTSDWHLGDPPYGPAIRTAAGRGYDISGLRARQFGPEDFDRFDRIIAMDRANLATIESLRPPGSGTPVTLLLSHAPEVPIEEVPDPYYTKDFEEALDLIESAAAGLIGQLQIASATALKAR